MPRRKQGSGDGTPAPGNESFAEIASTGSASEGDIASLREQVADLESRLAEAERLRGEAERAALAAAENQGGILLQSPTQEVATGKRVRVQRVDKYEVSHYVDGGRPVMKPKMKTVELPTYFYKIDLPPVGGMSFSINDTPCYHGTIVELDIDTLRSVKEIIYRQWDHERNISGSNENFYRQSQNKRLSARGA